MNYKSKSSKRIYVGNINRSRDRKELKKLFKKIGEIAEFVLYKDEAYIEYVESYEAKKAIERLNGEKYMDKKLLVEWAHLDFNKFNQRDDRGDRGERMDRGYRGGRPSRSDI